MLIKLKMLRSLMGTIVARRSLSSNNSSNDSHPLERRIGSKKDFPAAIQAADAKVYNLALNGAGVDDHVEEDKDQPHRGGGGGGRVRPLFGVIPAQAAVLDFIRNDLNFDPNLLEHTELYFEQFEPFPEEGGIVKTIVELSDIQEIRDDAILTFDTATRNEDERFLVFNQFVFRLCKAELREKRARNLRRVFFTGKTATRIRLDDCLPEQMIGHKISAAQKASLDHLYSVFSKNSSNNSIDHRFNDDYDVVWPEPQMPDIPYALSLAMAVQLILRSRNIPSHRLRGVKAVMNKNPGQVGDPLSVNTTTMGRNTIGFNTQSKTMLGPKIHEGNLFLHPLTRSEIEDRKLKAMQKLIDP